MSAELRIIDYNYLFQSNTGISATSSDSNFPASNVGKYHRSRVWRSSGYFKITSTNKYIDFKEAAAGAELNAVLAEGEYTPSTLATQIKSALETVGGDTYTVSYSSSTGKWTISSNGSELLILWSSGTNAANTLGSTIGFDVASDNSGSLSYTGASIAIHSVERVIIDLKTSDAVDSFAVIFDPTIGVKYSESATFTLKGNQTLNWDSPAVSTSLTLDEDNQIITHFYTSDQEYRYWCLEISDPCNPYLYVEISNLMLGKYTQIKCVANGFSLTHSDQSVISKTPYGHDYVDVYPVKKGIQFNFPLMEKAEVEALLKVYNRVGVVVPIGLFLDATELVLDKDTIAIYGKFSENIGYSHIVRDLFTGSVTVEETF